MGLRGRQVIGLVPIGTWDPHEPHAARRHGALSRVPGQLKPPGALHEPKSPLLGGLGGPSCIGPGQGPPWSIATKGRDFCSVLWERALYQPLVKNQFGTL